MAVRDVLPRGREAVLDVQVLAAEGHTARQHHGWLRVIDLGRRALESCRRHGRLGPTFPCASSMTTGGQAFRSNPSTDITQRHPAA